MNNVICYPEPSTRQQTEVSMLLVLQVGSNLGQLPYPALWLCSWRSYLSLCWNWKSDWAQYGQILHRNPAGIVSGCLSVDCFLFLLSIVFVVAHIWCKLTESLSLWLTTQTAPSINAKSNPLPVITYELARSRNQCLMSMLNNTDMIMHETQRCTWTRGKYSTLKCW